MFYRKGVFEIDDLSLKGNNTDLLIKARLAEKNPCSGSSVPRAGHHSRKSRKPPVTSSRALTPAGIAAVAAEGEQGKSRFGGRRKKGAVIELEEQDVGLGAVAADDPANRLGTCESAGVQGGV